MTKRSIIGILLLAIITSNALAVTRGEVRHRSGRVRHRRVVWNPVLRGSHESMKGTAAVLVISGNHARFIDAIALDVNVSRDIERSECSIRIPQETMTCGRAVEPSSRYRAVEVYAVGSRGDRSRGVK